MSADESDETKGANGEVKSDAAPASESSADEEKKVSAPPPPPPDPLETAKADAAKYREQLLRTAADFDNFRKRSRRETDDAMKKGKELTVKELLPVFDNLERAISSSDGAKDVKSVADGLRMITRQFAQTLEKMGITRVPTVGQPFDPMRHEAIQNVFSTEHPAGVITAEVQAGYLLGEFLVRAAMVVVSKGVETPEPEGDEPKTDD